MIDKILNKYKARLVILRENNMYKDISDVYPYDLEIKTTKEVISDIEKIKLHITENTREQSSPNC